MDGGREFVSKYDTLRLPTMFVSPEAAALIQINYFNGNWAKAVDVARYHTEQEVNLSDRLFWGRVLFSLMAAVQGSEN